jgi:ribonuclease HI
MSDADHLVVNIDGAARGNPGPAAFGYVIQQDGEPIIEEAGRLGQATNNVAEYTALVRALGRAEQLGARRLLVRSDSELLVKQMNGIYQVKNEQLRALFQEAKRLCGHFDLVRVAHVRREENSRADRLCNEVLDGLRESVSVPAPPSAEPKPKRRGAPQEDQAREAALAHLRAATEAWARGVGPSPEALLDQLWPLLRGAGRK